MLAPTSIEGTHEAHDDARAPPAWHTEVGCSPPP